MFIGILLFLSALIIPQVIVYNKERKRDQLLKSSIYNLGIIKDKYKITAGLEDRIIIIHYIDGREIISNSFRIDEDKCLPYLHIGDSVLISYSTEDPKIVTLKDCHWSFEKHMKLIGNVIN